MLSTRKARMFSIPCSNQGADIEPVLSSRVSQQATEVTVQTCLYSPDADVPSCCWLGRVPGETGVDVDHDTDTDTDTDTAVVPVWSVESHSRPTYSQSHRKLIFTSHEHGHFPTVLQQNITVQTTEKIQELGRERKVCCGSNYFLPL